MSHGRCFTSCCRDFMPAGRFGRLDELAPNASDFNRFAFKLQRSNLFLLMKTFNLPNCFKKRMTPASDPCDLRVYSRVHRPDTVAFKFPRQRMEWYCSHALAEARPNVIFAMSKHVPCQRSENHFASVRLPHASVSCEHPQHFI